MVSSVIQIICSSHKMVLALQASKVFAHHTACLHTRYTSGLQLQQYHYNVYDFVSNFMCSCQRFAAAAQASPVGLSALLSCRTLCAHVCFAAVAQASLVGLSASRPCITVTNKKKNIMRVDSYVQFVQWCKLFVHRTRCFSLCGLSNSLLITPHVFTHVTQVVCSCNYITPMCTKS